MSYGNLQNALQENQKSISARSGADKCLLKGLRVQIFNKEFFWLLFVLMCSQYCKVRDTHTFFVHMAHDDVIFMNN